MREIAILLTYPYPNFSILHKRITEIALLGIESIILEGDVYIGRFKILGKGTTSLVMKAYHRVYDVVTLKLRRTDANRVSLIHEAKVLNYLNRFNVGPELYCYSKNALIWKYIDGYSFEEVIEKLSDEELRIVMNKVLHQLYILDKVRVVHHELSRPEGHILVTKNLDVYIIDFESATMDSKKKNLTQFLQYILFNTKCEKIRKILGIDAKKRSNIVEMLRKYKTDINIFKSIMRIL